MLLDSNIVIYIAKPQHTLLRKRLADEDHYIASVTRIESLGFHRFELLPANEKFDLEEIVSTLVVLPLDEQIIRRTIAMRRERNMGLADAIIAATALVHGLALATHNVEDFKHIKGLEIIDPLAA